MAHESKWRKGGSRGPRRDDWGRTRKDYNKEYSKDWSKNYDNKSENWASSTSNTGDWSTGWQNYKSEDWTHSTPNASDWSTGRQNKKSENWTSSTPTASDWSTSQQTYTTENWTPSTPNASDQAGGLRNYKNDDVTWGQEPSATTEAPEVAIDQCHQLMGNRSEISIEDVYAKYIPPHAPPRSPAPSAALSATAAPFTAPPTATATVPPTASTTATPTSPSAAPPTAVSNPFPDKKSSQWGRRPPPGFARSPAQGDDSRYKLNSAASQWSKESKSWAQYDRSARDLGASSWRASARPVSSQSGMHTPKQQPHAEERNNRNVRKTVYKPFMDAYSVETMLKTNDLYRGIIRINKRIRNDAYVTSDELDADIYVCGSYDRNRALEGDVVAVKLLDVDTVWQKRTEREQKRQGKSNASAKKSLGNKENGADNNDNNSIQKPKYCGEVVLILDRAEGLSFTGTVSLNKPGPPGKNDRDDRAPRRAWFRPKDNRVPLIVIPLPCPQLEHILHNEDKYKNVLYEAQITQWGTSSLHPLGVIVHEIGNCTDFSVMTKAILVDHQVIDTPFSPLVTQSLPVLPWTIPGTEYTSRRDFRNDLVFTIDPATAKDLDDAVHCKLLSDGTYEVGVHIADVSFFVKPNTMLNTEARKRSTSTYLVNGVVPMLPAILCEELCSLNPHVDRLAFSVVWIMQADGAILDTWFGKSIIKSCAKLAYEDAQSVIDGNGLPSTTNMDKAHISYVEDAIMALFRLSQQLRQKRYANGALSMDSVKLCFTLDAEGQPEDMWIFEAKEANKLIEEFMLCANKSVAETIVRHYPDEALLRRHAPPIERRLNEFIDLAKELGYDFDGSSAGSLQEAFNGITDEHVKQVLLVLGIRPMQRAKYFCAGALDVAKYKHYALNEPFYTHFTSPIRRYADVIVHRQLLAAIEDQDHCNLTTKMVQKMALECNRKKDGAKNAQEASTMVYLAVFLHRLTLKQGPIIRPAVVLGVHSKAVEIYVPDYGLERKISMDSLPLERFEHKNRTLTVYWQHGVVVDMALEKELYGKTRERKDDYDEEEDMNGMEASKDELDDVGYSLSSMQVTDEFVNNSPCVGHEIAPVDDSLTHEPELDEATCMQRFRMFTKLQVLVQVDMEQFPPSVRIFLMNPFVDPASLYPQSASS